MIGVKLGAVAGRRVVDVGGNRRGQLSLRCSCLLVPWPSRSRLLESGGLKVRETHVVTDRPFRQRVGDSDRAYTPLGLMVAMALSLQPGLLQGQSTPVGILIGEDFIADGTLNRKVPSSEVAAP